MDDKNQGICGSGGSWWPGNWVDALRKQKSRELSKDKRRQARCCKWTMQLREVPRLGWLRAEWGQILLACAKV